MIVCAHCDMPPTEPLHVCEWAAIDWCNAATVKGQDAYLSAMQVQRGATPPPPSPLTGGPGLMYYAQRHADSLMQGMTRG